MTEMTQAQAAAEFLRDKGCAVTRCAQMFMVKRRPGAVILTYSADDLVRIAKSHGWIEAEGND